jgi:hypothetical protein
MGGHFSVYTALEGLLDSSDVLDDDSAHLTVHIGPIVIVFLPGGFPCPIVPPSGQ